MNRAKKLARFMDMGGTEEDACVSFGVSRASIKNLLGLLDAPVVVRKAVESGQITTSDAYKLAKMPAEVARAKVEKLKAEAPREPGKKRSKNAKKWAREIIEGPNGAAPVRGPMAVRAMLKVIERDESISENKRMGAVAALQWVLGDENALSAIMDMETGT